MEPGEPKGLFLMEPVYWIRKQGCKEPAVVCFGLQLQGREVLSL